MDSAWANLGYHNKTLSQEKKRHKIYEIIYDNLDYMPEILATWEAKVGGSQI
jgi:hypothetical protein